MVIIRRRIQAGERLWIEVFGQNLHSDDIIWMVIKIMIYPKNRPRLDRRDGVQTGAVNKGIKY